MGIELLDIGVKMRKLIISTVRGCYRSVCNHPFLVGMLCFLVLLYRSSPFMFSLLVSTSPVLVCTAVLLGTLLSFGQPNIPEIEIEEKTTHEAVLLKTGVSSDANGIVVDKNESYYVERYSENERDEPERGNSSFGKEISREVGLDDTAPLIGERSREVELDGGDLRFELRSEWNEERLSDGEGVENKYASVPNVDDDEHLELDDDDDEKGETDSFGSETVNVDTLDSPPRSPWTRIEEREEVEEEDDVLDSESDRAESSSPDASMADIMPMLDELHPLLDDDAPQPVPMSRDGSPRSRTDGHDESDDGSENHDDLDGPDDDKDEPTKSAITWTEEDEKNLMDLGSSEIERNIRLENLIMRRRSRKNMSMIPERNLIDLESSNLPFNVAPITTRRQNPFDSPHDAYYDNSGLPPIPGSAPSILLPRRNPFDIPYDSSEEKPDLMRDGFQEEFTRNQPRDLFFSRHQSFNIRRPSVFAPNSRDAKMRPYFVPEGMISEESSYSSFQRQSSELSDYSKVSSVPETESIGSVEDVEEMKGEIEAGLSQDLELDQDEKENVLALQLGGVLELENVGPLEKVETSGYSSSSSSLEVSERVFTVTEGDDDLSVLEERRDFVAQEPEISAQTYVESVEPSIASTSLNEAPHREPVYDLSPRALMENLSSSSISSDLLVESSIIDSDEHESRPFDVAMKSPLEACVEENVRVSEPPFEGQLREEYSVGINETVQSPNSDNDVDNESNYKLISDFSDEENSSLIYDNAIEERVHKHLDEVEVSSASVDTSEIREIDHDILSNINSPFSPNVISTSFETTTSHVDVQTTLEEVDEINEIDEELLSELDNVGDFSISSLNVFEKRIDSIEVNKIENENETVSAESEPWPAYPVVGRDYEHTVFGMDEFEARTVEEIDLAFKQVSDEEIEKLVSLEPPQSLLASVAGPTHETPILELRAIPEEFTFLPAENVMDGKTEEEVKPTFDDVSHEVEAPGTSSEIFVEEPVCEEITSSPLEEVVDGDTENQVKDREISAVSFERPEQKVEAEGISSELLVEDPASIESTDLPSEEVVDDRPEDQVKTHSNDVSPEIKKEEIRAVAFERPEQKVEAQGTSLESLVEEAVRREITDFALDEVSDGNIEIRKDKEISAITFEHPELKVEAQGTFSKSDVEEPVSNESTNLPPAELLHGNTENWVKPHSDDQSVEIKKDKQISVVASEQYQLKGDPSELLIAGPDSKESSNLPLEEVVDGDTEKPVKPNSEDVSLETTKNKEVSVVAFEKPEHVEVPVPGESTNLPSLEVADIAAEKPKHKFEAPQEVNLASPIKGKGKLSKSSSSSSDSSSDSE